MKAWYKLRSVLRLKNLRALRIMPNPLAILNNEQSVLLSNLKMLLAVGNGDFTLPHLSSSEIECLITEIATM